MKSLKSLMFCIVIAVTSNAWAGGKTLWSCDVTGGKSSLESVEVDLTRTGLYGSAMYNRPFDDEASYDVRVSESTASGKLEFSGRGAHGGTFDLVLETDGKTRPGEQLRGKVSGFIPAQADPTGFGSESYSDVRVECTTEGK